MKVIEELEAALAAATPGEWDDNGLGVFATHPDGEATYIMNGTQSDGVKNDPNVVLTTPMHNHLPALIEAVKALRETLDAFTHCNETYVPQLKLSAIVREKAETALENLK